MQWVPLQRATTFLLSSKKAVILRVPMQRATLSLNEERRHIANPSATGTPPSLDEERRLNYENIFKVEDAGRLV